MKKVRFQIGLKRKPPQGWWLSDFLGRKWWDFGQSLKKAPCARTALVNQNCSVKSHLLFFFRQETTKKGMSTRHKHYTNLVEYFLSVRSVCRIWSVCRQWSGACAGRSERVQRGRSVCSEVGPCAARLERVQWGWSVCSEVGACAARFKRLFKK